MPPGLTKETAIQWTFEQYWSDRNAILKCGPSAISLYQLFEQTGFLDTNLLPPKPADEEVCDMPEEGLALADDPGADVVANDSASVASSQVAAKLLVLATPIKRKPSNGFHTPQGATKFRSPSSENMAGASPAGIQQVSEMVAAGASID